MVVAFLKVARASCAPKAPALVAFAVAVPVAVAVVLRLEVVRQTRFAALLRAVGPAEIAALPGDVGAVSVGFAVGSVLVGAKTHIRAKLFNKAALPIPVARAR